MSPRDEKHGVEGPAALMADEVVTPVESNRVRAAAESAKPRGRMYAMEKVRAWDGSRLGYRFIKRTFDILFSLVVLIVALVPGLILALLIRLETPGNPFYGQLRVGKVDAGGAILPTSRCGSSALWFRGRMP